MVKSGICIPAKITKAEHVTYEEKVRIAKNIIKANNRKSKRLIAKLERINNATI